MLEYWLEYFVQHLLGCLPLLVQPLLKIIAVDDWNPQQSDH